MARTKRFIAKPAELTIRSAFILVVLAATVGLILVVTNSAPFQSLNAWYYALPQTHYVERIQISEFRSDIKVTSFAAHMAILCAQTALSGMLIGWFICRRNPMAGRWSLPEKAGAVPLSALTGGVVLAYTLSCFVSLSGTADVCSLYSKEGVIDAGHAIGFLMTAVLLYAAAWRLVARRNVMADRNLLVLSLLLLGTAAFALGMEEISWGQTYLGWQSPEFFQTYNDQQETNAHNFFNAFLTPIYYAIGVAVLVGTVVALALTERFGDRLPWLRIVCPPRVLLWVAVWFPIGSEIFILSSTEAFETLLMIYGLTYATALLARTARVGTAAGAGQRVAAEPIAA